MQHGYVDGNFLNLVSFDLILNFPAQVKIWKRCNQSGLSRQQEDVIMLLKDRPTDFIWNFTAISPSCDYEQGFHIQHNVCVNQSAE